MRQAAEKKFTARRIIMEGLLEPTHLFFILLIVLIIFGPGKLPDLGRGLGKGIREFKGALKGATEEVKDTGNKGG
jgi:sec-independent protein translocase protein TatA